VKVLDFGLARRLPEPSSDSGDTEDLALQTAEGVVLGTPRYMAPEQAHGRPADGRSDLFAFGALLHELFSGRPAFDGDSPLGVLSAVLRDTPPALDSLRPDCPPALARLVTRLLEKEPARRPAGSDEVLAELRALQAGTTAVPAPSPPPRAGRGRWSALAVALLVAASVGGLLLWRARRAPEASGFRLLTTSGSQRSPTFAPDGQSLAYVEEGAGVPQLWARRLDGGPALQLTHGEGAVARPRWSPRGDRIVFERRGQGLWWVPPLGGAAQQVLPVGSCPAFFPDGERLAFERADGLWTARLDGSQARHLEGLPEGYYDTYVKRCPAVSPDGRLLAFYRAERGPVGDIWLVPAGGGQPRQLTFDSAPAGSPAFTPDGRFVIYSSQRAGGRTLWLVPVSGGPPRALTSGAGEDVEPDVSADGRRLVYATLRHTEALVVQPLQGGAPRTLLERREHTNGARFSPDGRQLAWFGATETGTHVFTLDLASGEIRQLTQGRGEENIMPRWFADGQRLAYYQTRPRQALLAVPAGGGPLATLADGFGWETHNGAVFDADGRNIVYTFGPPGQAASTRVRDLASGAERALGEVLWSPRWSPDGKQVAGMDDHAQVTVCDAAGGLCRALGPGRTPVVWSADGRRLRFRRPGPGLDDPDLRTDEIWEVALDGTPARHLATLSPVLRLSAGFDVSGDDRLAWIQHRPGRQELWLATLAR
jgi:Tol biopolymer transport system component